MFKASDKLLIGEGNIDSSGHFKILFPSTREEALYRMHIIKRNDPISTLIIGSEDENHVFFIAKDSNEIYIDESNAGKTINQNNVRGTIANGELNNLMKTMNSISPNRDSLKDQFIVTAEKSKSELVGLLAIYSSFGLSPGQKNKINKAVHRFNPNNPYGSRIFEEYKRQNNTGILLFVISVFSIPGLVLMYRLFKKRSSEKISQSLSLRETNIVQRILDGKANKEIATELNIELSTVKTHVNNIYAKLKIGSRKELMKYKEIFDKKGNDKK
jgi:DNA-binding NarL/FixJ family response regulator